MEKDNKEILGFCPDCGTPIYESHTITTTDGHSEESYTCESCNGTFKEIVVPKYKVGEQVKWNDPCREPSESMHSYKARCNQIRTITDILFLNGDDSDSIAYELDNGTEVFGYELSHC